MNGFERWEDAIRVNEQSSIRIEGGKILYFDPFRLPDEPHDADFIFLTHDHFDHYSPADLRKALGEHTIVLLPETMVSVRSALGLDGDRSVLMKAGDRRILYDVEFEAVPAYNIGKPFHPQKNGCLGWLVTMDGCRFYVTGDTDATPEAEAVRADILFVPIGGTYTTDAREAAELTNRIGPSAVVPTHYGTVVGKEDMFDDFAPRVKNGIAVWKKLFVRG